MNGRLAADRWPSGRLPSVLTKLQFERICAALPLTRLGDSNNKGNHVTN